MRKTNTQRELGNEFGDSRLKARFTQTVKQLGGNLSSSIPQAAGTKKDTKGMYRFFDNKSVEPQKMLAAHRADFLEDADKKLSGLFFQLTDTVEMDFTGKKSSKKLGPMNYANRRGLYQQNSLIANAKGVVMGLLHQSYVIREDKDFGQAEARKALPFEQKESYRWKEHFLQGQALCEEHPELQGVFIADREADIMELFLSRTCDRMHLLIRSKQNRKLADEWGNLYEHLGAQSAQGTYRIQVIDPQQKKERTAELEVRFCKVDIKLYKARPLKRGLPAVTLYAVEAREINPPAAIEKPIRWVLLTTLPVEDFQQAMLVIGYYQMRWLIERFHYLLKSGGANVEELQLEEPDRLKNAITTYSIAVLNTFKIKYLAEKVPETTIYEAGISPVEYQVLYTYVHKRVDPKVRFDPEHPPNVAEFCRVLGQLGAFFPSKRQPLPGLKILSRAIQKLNTLVDSYLTFFPESG